MSKSRKIPVKRQVTSEVSERWSWVLLGIILILFAAIRIRLLSVPIERDEGEYAYAGQLILHGIPPYKLAYNMKLPGIYYAYAGIMAIFGQSVIGIHLGLLLVNLGAIVLMYLLGRKLFDTTVGLVSAASYGFLTVNLWVYGPQAHATHFVVLPALAGMLFALKAAKSGKPIHVVLSGLLFGIAFTMKQQGAFFGLLGFLSMVGPELWQRPVNVRRMAGRTGLFALAAAAPVLIICVVLAASGVFDKFWFWAVKYATQYVSEVPLAVGFRVFLVNTMNIVRPSWMIWAMAAAGLILLWLDRESRKRAAYVTAFLVLGFLTICPGFYFRPHYYITLMPPVALLVGVAVGADRNVITRTMTRRVFRNASAAVFVLLFIVTLSAHSAFLFDASPATASRMMYPAAPWTEAQEIAKYIKSHTAPTDKIAVLGSEPEIFFFSDRESATGYIYFYSLLEEQTYAHKMQEDMIHEIEQSKPKYLVYMPAKTWLVRRHSDQTIFKWTNEFCVKNYWIDGVVHMKWIGPDWDDFQTDYVWGEKAGSYPIDDACILVYVRK